MDQMEKMDKVLFAVFIVFGVIIVRLIALPEDSVLGSVITNSSILGLFGWCYLVIFNRRSLESTSRAEDIE